MHRNNSNLNLLDTVVQKEFAVNALLASNTDWFISQNGNYSYIWHKSSPHPMKIKFSPVPAAVLAWNFVECYVGALVNVKNKIGRNTTLKWEELSFYI